MKKILLLFSLVLLFGSSCHKTVIIIEEYACETCYDGIQNQNETGIDCGGVCFPCDIISDTIVIFDTIILIDTVMVIDTVIVIDTVFVSDTIISMILQPNSINGKDAVIHSLDLFTSGISEYFWAASWTWNTGDEGVMRSLIEFELSLIPDNLSILDARLSLYGKPEAPDQHSSLSGSNTSWVQRITSSWEEDEVTWNNQPTTTTNNQVSLQESFKPTQDYCDIDVTLLVRDMIENPTNSFGFMIKLKTEEIYRMMAFATSDNTDSSIRPKLKIVYQK